jgi:hypothetical protein
MLEDSTDPIRERDPLEALCSRDACIYVGNHASHEPIEWLATALDEGVYMRLL